MKKLLLLSAVLLLFSIISFSENFVQILPQYTEYCTITSRINNNINITLSKNIRDLYIVILKYDNFQEFQTVSELKYYDLLKNNKIEINYNYIDYPYCFIGIVSYIDNKNKYKNTVGDIDMREYVKNFFDKINNPD